MLRAMPARKTSTQSLNTPRKATAPFPGIRQSSPPQLKLSSCPVSFLWRGTCHRHPIK
jgi:hypothetical protein